MKAIGVQAAVRFALEVMVPPAFFPIHVTFLPGELFILVDGLKVVISPILGI